MYNKSRFQNTPLHFANVFEGLLNPEFNSMKHQASVNISENATQYELHVVAPGLHKEDFKIDVDKNILTVSYEQHSENKESDSNWIRQEFRMSSFKRSFSLNEKIDVANINALYENGVLMISLPKKEKEEVKIQTISVK
jgi:HSP20 family protein